MKDKELGEEPTLTPTPTPILAPNKYHEHEHHQHKPVNKLEDKEMGAAARRHSDLDRISACLAHLGEKSLKIYVDFRTVLCYSEVTHRRQSSRKLISYYIDFVLEPIRVCRMVEYYSHLSSRVIIGTSHKILDSLTSFKKRGL